MPGLKETLHRTALCFVLSKEKQEMVDSYKVFFSISYHCFNDWGGRASMFNYVLVTLLPFHNVNYRCSIIF